MSRLHTIARLTARATSSRSSIAATAVSALSIAAVSLGGAFSRRLQRGSAQAPIDRFAAISKVLEKQFEADVATALMRINPCVLLAGLTLLAIVPLVGGALGAGIDPSKAESSSPGVRFAAAVLACGVLSCVLTIFGASLAVAAAPGAFGSVDARHAVMFARISFVAALPSIGIAVVVRGAVRGALGAAAAWLAMLVLRYGAPSIAGKGLLAHWLVPRTYELTLLSSHADRVALAAFLCVAWPCALLALQSIATHRTLNPFRSRSTAGGR